MNECSNPPCPPWRASCWCGAAADHPRVIVAADDLDSLDRRERRFRCKAKNAAGLLCNRRDWWIGQRYKQEYA